jgi:hypothetical protein
MHVWRNCGFPNVGVGSLVGSGENVKRQTLFTLLPTSSSFKLPFVLFNKILDKVVRHVIYFCQKSDTAGTLGLSLIGSTIDFWRFVNRTWW